LTFLRSGDNLPTVDRAHVQRFEVAWVVLRRSPALVGRKRVATFIVRQNRKMQRAAEAKLVSPGLRAPAGLTRGPEAALLRQMCNLYSITRSQEAMRRLFRIARDLTGNLPPMSAVYPNTLAPVVRSASDGERELVLMRWGFPPPPNVSKAPVTNVRNLKSPYWRGWLKAECRCLVPATSFCEWTDSRPKVTHWFAVDESRPLFAFAGIWRLWTGERKGESGRHQLFAFLTTAANEVVRPIHAEAMPVLLTTAEEWETWLRGSPDEAMALQRPVPNEMLRIVATGEKSDEVAERGQRAIEFNVENGREWD
jgi:putative SOS response-associated peptidase YedK